MALADARHTKSTCQRYKKKTSLVNTRVVQLHTVPTFKNGDKQSYIKRSTMPRLVMLHIKNTKNHVPLLRLTNGY